MTAPVYTDELRKRAALDRLYDIVLSDLAERQRERVDDEHDDEDGAVIVFLHQPLLLRSDQAGAA